jgi:hypothetical protein
MIFVLCTFLGLKWDFATASSEDRQGGFWKYVNWRTLPLGIVVGLTLTVHLQLLGWSMATDSHELPPLRENIKGVYLFYPGGDHYAKPVYVYYVCEGGSWVVKQLDATELAGIHVDVRYADQEHIAWRQWLVCNTPAPWWRPVLLFPWWSWTADQHKSFSDPEFYLSALPVGAASIE